LNILEEMRENDEKIPEKEELGQIDANPTQMPIITQKNNKGN